jgi:hypothetical protein
LVVMYSLQGMGQAQGHTSGLRGTRLGARFQHARPFQCQGAARCSVGCLVGCPYQPNHARNQAAEPQPPRSQAAPEARVVVNVGIAQADDQAAALLRHGAGQHGLERGVEGLTHVLWGGARGWWAARGRGGLSGRGPWAADRLDTRLLEVSAPTGGPLEHGPPSSTGLPARMQLSRVRRRLASPGLTTRSTERDSSERTHALAWPCAQWWECVWGRGRGVHNPCVLLEQLSTCGGPGLAALLCLPPSAVVP